MKTSILTLFLALQATAGAASALQGPEAAPASNPRPLVQRSVHEASHGTLLLDGAPTGIGSRYKARFEPGRFVFLPALGAAAARDYPIAFALEGVWRGETALHLADGEALPAMDANGVTYLHGASIEERYDVTPQGVQQSYLFLDPLPGAGDLVVRGTLSTDLVGEPADDGSLLFRREGHPALRWGAVTGIDADGRRVAGSLRQEGTSLELVLPGAFVDGAAFPLLLDPLIGTEIILNDDGTNDSSPEVAWGGFRNLIVWQRVFSLVHGEIYGQMVDLFGDLTGPLVPIATGATVVAREPSVGYVQATDHFLVAMSHANSFLNTPQVRVCSVNANGTTVSSLVSIASSANVQGSPDVGGDRTGSDDEAFVVWSESSVGVRGRTVNVPDGANPVPFGSAFTIDPTTVSTDPIRPRISKHIASGTDFLVVWQRASGSRNFVMGRMYDRNGVVKSSAFPLYTNGFVDHSRPDCDGDGDTFLVAWERGEGLTATETDVVCRSFHWDGTAISANSLVRVVEGDDADDETAPSVAFNRYGSSAIAYLDDNGGSNDVYLRNVDPFTGVAVGEVLLANTATSAIRVSICTLGSDRSLVVWDDDQDILGARYDGVGESVGIGGSCGNGGQAWIPNAIADNSSFRIHLRGSTPGVLAACVTGLSNVPIGCGTCTLHPSLEAVYYDTTDAFGNASVGIPLLASYGGVTFYSQWVTFPSVGACPLAPIDFADAMRTTIGSNP